MANQKGFVQVLIIIAAVIVLGAAAFYFMANRNSTAPVLQIQSQAPSGSSQTSVPGVNTPQDLITVSNDLDNTNIDGLNTTLNQNDSDASSF